LLLSVCPERLCQTHREVSMPTSVLVDTLVGSDEIPEQPLQSLELSQ
jgi:hypothetical protein